MSIDPLDRPHDQQPVPGQEQNPSHTADPAFVTDNPDIPGTARTATDRPATGRDVRQPGNASEDDINEPGLGNPLP
ncbi:hypothetical protein JQR85_06750 [Stutzerimonas urumqiensis]|uniref:hypothetical protein n=1 Tax=Stutzerimonas urumqiensis TaxID=638269 RepID=UPI003DA40A60